MRFKLSKISTALVLGMAFSVSALSITAGAHPQGRHAAGSAIPPVNWDWQNALYKSGLLDRLRSQYRERLAGLSIEHFPEEHVRVRLKGDDPVGDEVVNYDSQTIRVEFIPGAAHSRDELLAVRDSHSAALKTALPELRSTYVDEQTGEIVLLMDMTGADPSGTLQQRVAVLSGQLGVPLRAETYGAVFTRRDRAEITGGGRLVLPCSFDACSTGFVVKKIAADGEKKGVLTSGHCFPGSHGFIKYLPAPNNYSNFFELFKQDSIYSGTRVNYVPVDIMWLTKAENDNANTFVPKVKTGTGNNTADVASVIQPIVGATVCSFAAKSQSLGCGIITATGVKYVDSMDVFGDFLNGNASFGNGTGPDRFNHFAKKVAAGEGEGMFLVKSRAVALTDSYLSAPYTPAATAASQLPVDIADGRAPYFTNDSNSDGNLNHVGNDSFEIDDFSGGGVFPLKYGAENWLDCLHGDSGSPYFTVLSKINGNITEVGAVGIGDSGLTINAMVAPYGENKSKSFFGITNLFPKIASIYIRENLKNENDVDGKLNGIQNKFGSGKNGVLTSEVNRIIASSFSELNKLIKTNGIGEGEYNDYNQTIYETFENIPTVNKCFFAVVQPVDNIGNISDAFSGVSVETVPPFGSGS